MSASLFPPPQYPPPRLPACPVCHAGLRRIRRRWFDRLLHWRRPVQRFRCTMLTCGWQGNLPRDPVSRDADAGPTHAPEAREPDGGGP